MTIQKINIKDIVGEQKKSSPKKSAKKESGSMLKDLGGTALAAMPLIPTKYKVIVGVVIFVAFYGTGSLIWDIISLIKSI